MQIIRLMPSPDGEIPSFSSISPTFNSSEGIPTSAEGLKPGCERCSAGTATQYCIFYLGEAEEIGHACHETFVWENNGVSNGVRIDFLSF